MDGPTGRPGRGSDSTPPRSTTGSSSSASPIAARPRRAGLQTGDVVQAVAGETPDDLAGLFRRIWSQGHAGAEIPLRIERDGRSFDQKVTSSERNRFFKVPRMH